MNKMTTVASSTDKEASDPGQMRQLPDKLCAWHEWIMIFKITKHYFEEDKINTDSTSQKSIFLMMMREEVKSLLKKLCEPLSINDNAMDHLITKMNNYLIES
jgi:hypothetical protein